MKHYYLHDRQASCFTSDIYGDNKRDALNRYRENWYPGRERLPRGVSI